SLRRRQDLSSEGAGESAGQTVLVGDSIQPSPPHIAARRDACQPRFKQYRSAKERGRLSRCLFRTRAAAGQRVELGADQAWARIRNDFSPLRSDRGAIRKDLEAVRRG